MSKNIYVLFLQTLNTISAEKNSTIVFPGIYKFMQENVSITCKPKFLQFFLVPIDFLSFFMRKHEPAPAPVAAPALAPPLPTLTEEK